MNSRDENEAATQARRKVTTLRAVVVAVLIGSASAVAIGVNFFLRRSEKKHFEETYRTAAENLMNSLANGLRKMLLTSDIMAVDILNYAQESNSSWPFVQQPNYATKAAKALQQVPSLYVQILMYVPAEDRAAWEAWVPNNHQWVEECLNVQRSDPNYPGRTRENYTVIDEMWSYLTNYQPVPNQTYGYNPNWQIYPVFDYDPPYNYDHFAAADNSAYMTAFTNKTTVITNTYLLPNPDNPDEVIQAEAYGLWYSNYLGPDDNPNEPVSEFIYPVIDSANLSPKFPSDGKVVMFFAMSFYWRLLLQESLGEGAYGDYHVVMSNPCDFSPFTFQVNGPNAKYLGQGDKHERHFDYLKIESKIYDVESFNDFEVSYLGTPFNKEYCPYTLSIYPTKTLESNFTSKSPTLFAILAAFVVAASSGVFLVYDILVQRRQNATEKSAAQSNAIVVSMFPSTVRDRILHGDTNIMALEAPTKRNLRSFLRGESNVVESELVTEGTRNSTAPNALMLYKSNPIADLFLETTTMVRPL